MKNNGFQEISLTEILGRGLSSYHIVDVRSPAEFEADHMPGSVNVPLLNDEERALTGTAYKNEGPKHAKLLALELVAPKLPQFIAKLDEESKKSKNFAIACWRGGLRSAAAVTLAGLAGIRALRLEGGYAAFRKHVHGFFEEFPADIKFITVFGPTGCAKTEILTRLASEGYPVVNLEKHARHKGSVFGETGEPDFYGVTQKNFETGIWHDIYSKKDKKLFFIEGESPKIGRVTVPKTLYNAMREGTRVLAEAPEDFRIDFTVKAYEPERHAAVIARCLANVKKYLGAAKTEELNSMLERKEFREFASFMLFNYYDPLYRHAFPKNINYNASYLSIDEGMCILKDIYNKEIKSYGF